MLRCAIKSKCPGMLSHGIILLHDNAHPHPVNLVRDKLKIFGWETLQHPPYSQDLSPCDFHIFGDLKEGIRGRRFHSDKEVKEWIKLWIHQRPTSFYKTGIRRLVTQWDKFHCHFVAGGLFSFDYPSHIIIKSYFITNKIEKDHSRITEKKLNFSRRCTIKCY